MEFNKILNNEVQVLINLIHIQEGLVGGHSNIKKKLKKNFKSISFDI
jgi:hypothetical protein